MMIMKIEIAVDIIDLWYI